MKRKDVIKRPGDEIKAEVVALEAEVNRALQSFTDKTGIPVVRIRVFRASSAGASNVYRARVELSTRWV